MAYLESRDQQMQRRHDYFHMGLGGKWQDCGKCIDALERQRKKAEDDETTQRLVDQEHARLNIWDGDLSENLVKPPTPMKRARAGTTRKKDRRQTVRRKEVTRHGERRKD